MTPKSSDTGRDPVFLVVSDDDSPPSENPRRQSAKSAKRSSAATEKRLRVAREKRQREKQTLLLEPESGAADAIREKRKRRAFRQGSKRAAARRDKSSTKAVGIQGMTPRSGKVSWQFEDRVQALLKYPKELFRVLPTVYGASKSTPCTFEAFNRLRSGKWFTDETVNYFFAALGQRTREPEQVAIVSSFFYNALMTHGVDSRFIKRFGRPIKQKESQTPGLLRGGLLLIPVNWRSHHWGLVSVHPLEKKMKVWDSLSSSGMGKSTELKGLISGWVSSEQEWRGQPHNESEWDWEVPVVPQQQNSDDCGVYLCAFASALARRTSIEVTDKDSAARFRAEMQYSALLAAVGYPH